MTKWIQLFTAAVLVFSLGACARNNSGSTSTAAPPQSTTKQQGSGGGLDGAGGDPILSTPDQVKAAAVEVWRHLTATKADNPLITAYLKLKSKQRSPEDEKIFKMLETILGTDGSELETNNDDPAGGKILNPTAVTKFLAAKKIRFLDKGPCQGSAKDTTASVSQLNLAGEVCLSLQRIGHDGQAVLRWDLTALLIHEIAHLNGYQEDDAVAIQVYFLNNMLEFQRQNGEETKYVYAKQVSQIAQLWRKMIVYDKLDVFYIASIRARAVILEVLSGMLQAPNWGDDLKVARPELYRPTNAKLDEVGSAEGKLEEDFFTDNPKKNPVPITEGRLAMIRNLFIANLDAEESLAEFYYGDGERPAGVRSADDIANDRKDVLLATDPKTLTDPALRPEWTKPDLSPDEIQEYEEEQRENGGRVQIKPLPPEQAAKLKQAFKELAEAQQKKAEEEHAKQVKESGLDE